MMCNVIKCDICIKVLYKTCCILQLPSKLQIQKLNGLISEWPRRSPTHLFIVKAVTDNGIIDAISFQLSSSEWTMQSLFMVLHLSFSITLVRLLKSQCSRILVQFPDPYFLTPSFRCVSSSHNQGLFFLGTCELIDVFSLLIFIW